MGPGGIPALCLEAPCPENSSRQCHPHGLPLPWPWSQQPRPILWRQNSSEKEVDRDKLTLSGGGLLAGGRPFALQRIVFIQWKYSCI